MDAATIREMNKMRKAMGMKPLPVPEDTPMSTNIPPPEEDEDVGSTIESRQAQAYDNYNKVREAEEAKARREKKATAAKKAREKAQRFAVLEGKGLAEEYGDDVGAKAWVMGLEKRKKKIAKRRKAEEEREAAEKAAAAAREYTAKDLAGVQIGHDISTLLDGDEQVLTLKDTTIEQNEAEGDELENIGLREQEQLKERLELKRKRPGYDPNDDEGDGERSLLAQYDEEIFGKQKKKFALGDAGEAAWTAQDPDADVAPGNNHRRIALDLALDDVPISSSDYRDVSEVKFKKPKRRSKSTRKRADDDEALLPADLPEPEVEAEADNTAMDLDGEVTKRKKRNTADDKMADDDDLQVALSISRLNALKKRKKNPEDFTKQLLQTRQEPEEANQGDDDEATGGLVLSDISMFLSGLQKPEEAEETKARKPRMTAEEPMTAMEVDSDEDEADGKSLSKPGQDADGERRNGADAKTAIVDEEKTFEGIGSTLAFLRERKLIKEANGAEHNEQLRQKNEFMYNQRQLEVEINKQCEKDKERDRVSGRLANMSVRERDEYQRQKNEYWRFQLSRRTAELWRNYKPSVNIEYRDAKGRNLDQKEAFKHLSHQFHGRGSGKGKTEKYLKKIEDEKRAEAKSMLDASQNAGMSSATAQQTKKRREAGVRLA